MPTIFIDRGYRFFFFSNEGDPREPMHIHVRKERSIAKYWIGDDIQLADSRGFSANELNIISKIINNRKTEIEAAWNEHFNT